MHLPPLFFVIIVLLVLLVIVAAALKAKLGGGAEPSGDASTYELRGPILTPAERSFLGALEQALPDGVGLLSKVRLGDIFKTRKGLTPSVRTRAGNQINQKHVDFLLVRTTDLTPVAGIELDDSSHARNDRQKRDAFVDDIFRSCNLPLLHVPAQATYRATDLRTQITALLNQAEPASLVQPAPERINAADLPGSNTTAQVHGAEIPPSLPSQPQAGDRCPRCSDGKLVQRTKRSTQGRFLGCSNYPRCGHTENL